MPREIAGDSEISNRAIRAKLIGPNAIHTEKRCNTIIRRKDNRCDNGISYRWRVGRKHVSMWETWARESTKVEDVRSTASRSNQIGEWCIFDNKMLWSSNCPVGFQYWSNSLLVGMLNATVKSRRDLLGPACCRVWVWWREMVHRVRTCCCKRNTFSFYLMNYRDEEIGSWPNLMESELYWHVFSTRGNDDGGLRISWKNLNETILTKQETIEALFKRKTLWTEWCRILANWNGESNGLIFE